MSSTGSPPSTTEISVDQVAAVRKRRERLVIAWAKEELSGELRYILELGENQRGKRCGCVCISCGQPLMAVNAARGEWEKRPHFRHIVGVEQHSCRVLSARAALLATLQEGDMIVLPRSRRSVSVSGLSGRAYEAWIELPPQTVKIRDVRFDDNLTAAIVLADGRRLKVLVTGTTDPAPEDSTGVMPHIIITVDTPDLAQMSPEELRRRLVPLIEGGTWCGHWPTPDLDAQKLDEAKALAVDALDWDDQGEELPADLRRESLLHREVKDILQSAQELILPGWDLDVSDVSGEVYSSSVRPWTATIKDAVLERRLGRIIPDVIARLGDDSELLIEVTVTNRITEERLGRIRQANLPAVEIDFSRMGGILNRARLRQLVLHELSGKAWLYHPDMGQQYALLQERARVGVEVRKELGLPVRRGARLTPQEWGQRFLTAVQRHATLRWASGPSDETHEEKVQHARRAVEEAAEALRKYGYPSAQDPRLYDYGHTVLERLLSIRIGKGVGYDSDGVWKVINAILSDINDTAKSWHVLYLIALSVYPPSPELTSRQQGRIAEWRALVIASIQRGESTYRRNTQYDDLFALLFPEMAERIRKPFGTRGEHHVKRPMPAAMPNEPSSKAFEELPPGLWLWATTADVREQRAEGEMRRARRAGAELQEDSILVHIARSRHSPDPDMFAEMISRKTGVAKAAVLRYLYNLDLINLMTRSI